LWSTSIFICNVVAVVPFLAGHSLYAYWDSVGKNLVRLAMGLLPVTAVCVGIAYSHRTYVRDLKEIHRKYGPKVR
jgi:hypothetical protein